MQCSPTTGSRTLHLLLLLLSLLMFLWLTVHYSNKLSLRSNLELSVSLKGTAVTGQTEEEHPVHEVIFWVSVWTYNLCVSTLSFTSLQHMMTQRPLSELFLHLLWLTDSSPTVSLMKTVIWVHYLLCSRVVYTALALEYAVMSCADRKIISECLNHAHVLPLGLLVRWLAVLPWSKHLQRNWPSFLS